MTDPQQEDLSHEGDDLVEGTGNGLTADDPAEQPSQDPAELPEGTVTAAGGEALAPLVGTPDGDA